MANAANSSRIQIVDVRHVICFDAAINADNLIVRRATHEKARRSDEYFFAYIHFPIASLGKIIISIIVRDIF